MSAERVADTPKKDDEKKTSSKAPVKVVRKSSNPASTTSATDANRPIRRQQQLKPVQPHNPAKIGKANPKRDIPLFLGLVGFLFLVAYSFSGVGTEKKQKSVREMQAELRKHIEASHAREQAKKRTMDCDLFIASSSIPGAGLGVFAGKRYDIGDEVVSLGLIGRPLVWRSSFGTWVAGMLRDFFMCFANMFNQSVSYLLAPPGNFLSCGEPTKCG